MKRCVVGIRRTAEPEGGAAKDAPTVWFPSMATMAAVLSEDNRALLRLIHDQRPPDLPPVDVPIRSGSPGSRLLDGYVG